MATTMKGIYKGFKFISHLFVVKEREMEIGLPTDVKHVAHIGLDGPDGSAPNWMHEFKAAPDFGLSPMNESKTAPDFGLSPVGSMGGSKGGSRDPTWTPQDFEQSLGQQQTPDICSNLPPTNLLSIPKKQKHKKGKSSSSSSKSNSSPKSTSSRSSRISRKSTLREREE